MQKYILIFLILLANNSFSQTRIYSNEFLSVGVGARALSMSGSVIAATNDVTSGYWNPAGLSSIDEKYEIAAMHSEYFAGIAKFDYIGAAYKINDSSSLGLSILRFGIDDIPNTLELIDENGNIDYGKIKHFSVADYAMLISYSKKSKIKGLKYGANVKLIYRNLGSFANGYGFGFDLGAIYEKNKWHFGANLRDATSTFNAWFFDNSQLEEIFNQTGNELPQNGLELTLPKLLLGVARDFKISQNFGLLTELDADFTFDGKRNVLIKSNSVNIDPHFGLEINYKKIVYVRGGIGNFAMIPDFDKEVLSFQPNFGIGLRFMNFSIDYALTDIGNQSIAIYSNIFSLSYKF